MHINTKQLILSLSICLLSWSLFSQNFSYTFDQIPESNESGKGMFVSEESAIYVNAGMVCQELTQSCSMTYKFDNNGNLLWNTLIDTINSLNWETIQVENDSIYIGMANFTASPNDYLSQAVFEDNTGEILRIFNSQYDSPEEITLSPFGQLIIDDKIYAFGSGWNHIESFNSPGYIHVMDKEGNYLHHLEYRQDNFNSIFQLMEGPSEDLYFLCASGNSLGLDNFWLVSWNPITDETEVVVHLPFQSFVRPFYTILSEQFVMTKHEYDFAGALPPHFALEGYSHTGDLQWLFVYERGFFSDDIGSYDILEITTCANDDFLISGEYDDGESNEFGFILRFNNLGELLWERRYKAYDDFGGLRDCSLSALREMPDGSIVAIGSMQQVSEFGAEEDFWILKVDENGCYREGEECDDLTVSQWITSTEDKYSEEEVIVFPNPVKDKLNIEAETLISNTTIYTIDGRLLSTQYHQSGDISIQIDDLPSGIYYLEIKTNDGDVMKKFIKL